MPLFETYLSNRLIPVGEQPAEFIRDTAALMMQGSGSVTVTVDDIANTVTIVGNPPANVLAEALVFSTTSATGNSSTSAHGFLAKLPGDATLFMNGQGIWSTPALGAAPIDVVRDGELKGVTSNAVFDALVGKADSSNVLRLSTGPEQVISSIVRFATAPVIPNLSGTNTGDQSDATLTFTGDVLTGNSTIGRHGFLPKLSGDATQFLNGAGNWAIPGGSAVAGEANTATNVGTGAGIFKAKSGVNLELRSLASANNKLTVALNTDPLNTNILFTVVDANLAIVDTQLTMTAGSIVGDVTTGKHGLAPIPPTINPGSNFLSGLGTWTAPTGTIQEGENVGTSGINIYLALAATKLQFKSLLGSPLISVTATAGNTITLDVIQSAISVNDTQITLADEITRNVSSSKHGFVPKLPVDFTGRFLDATGAWTIPPGNGEVNSAENLGLDAVGLEEVYASKDATTKALQFRRLKATSNKISITSDATTVGFDVNQANLTISSGQLNLDGTVSANVTTARHGLVPTLSGVGTQYLSGTGLWTVPPTPPIDQLLPSQTGKTGQFLKTDGAVSSWSSLGISGSNTGDVTIGTSANGLSLSGQILSLSNIPVTAITGLGTSATKDVAATGNASATQVVLGSDSRLSTTVGVTLDTAQTISGAKILANKFQVNQSLGGEGTVSNTAASAAVTGAGTKFLSLFRAGDTIIIASITYIIQTVDSDLQLTLRAAITSANAAGTTYTTGNAERLRVEGNGNVNVSGTANFTGPVTAGGRVEMNAAASINAASSTDTNWIRAVKNTVSAFVGGNDGVSGYTATDFSGAFRFNGAGIAWGDFGYFPNGGTLGNFRFMASGGLVATTPNASVGVGSLISQGAVTGSNLSGTNTGDVSIGATANGLSLSGQVLSLSSATAAVTGALSGADWTTFNNKQAQIGFTPENASNKGVNNGYAGLDAGGLIPAVHLPSYVDDVLEVANFATLPATGAPGKIYVTLDNNLTYRWSGTVYVEISASLALGTASSTAFRGDFGQTAYTHSQIVTGNPHGSTTTDIAEGTKLYYTDARFDARLALKTTDNLSQGTTNLYNQTHTGDVTGATALTIGANKVTLSMVAQVATGVFLGRVTALSGNVETLTGTQAKTLLALVKGDVGLGSVVNLDTSTTINITDSLNKRFVTDAQQTNIGNQSGTNTGNVTIGTANGLSIAGQVLSLSGIPIAAITGLGTAATKDVPATGNATATQIVLGSDSRLTATSGVTLDTSQTILGAKIFANRFQVNQPTVGVGTVSNAAASAIVTGAGTTFLTTFKVGDTIIFGGITHTISTVDTDLQVTVGAAITAANALGTGYTTGGSERFRVDINGRVGIFNLAGSGVQMLTVDNLGFLSKQAINSMAMGGTIAGPPASATGSLLFVGAGGVLSQNNANLFWDNANLRLGIGTSTPTSRFQVAGYIRFDDTYYGTFIGLNAGTNSTWIGNTVVGWNAGVALTSAAGNTFIGAEAGRATTTGGSNTFIGRETGKNNVTGSGNVFVGDKVGELVTGAVNLVLMGSSAGGKITTAEKNVAIGANAGFANITGNDNLYIGSNAGYGALGAANTIIGVDAGQSSSLGSGNVFIGRGAGGYETGSNKLIINNAIFTTHLIYGEFDNRIVNINANLTTVGTGVFTGAVTGPYEAYNSTTWNAAIAVGAANKFATQKGVYDAISTASVPGTSVYISRITTGGIVTQADIDTLGITDQKELIVNAVTQLNANVIIPKNIYVSYEGVGIWKPAAAATLTIRWMQDAGNRLLFTNVAAQAIGNIAFGKNAVPAFRLAWWTGNATGGDYTTAMKNIIDSMHTNFGGVCYLPVGDFEFTQSYNPPSSSVFKGAGCSVAGSYAATSGGGTTLRFTTANSQLFYVGSLTANTPNNQRSVRFQDLSITLSGAALTTSTGLLVSGGGSPQQNIYGVECRNVAFNGGKYCVNVGMTSNAQVENVNFDHCFFIGGAEACFRLQTKNGTTNFTQPYFSAVAGKDCVRIHDCGVFTMSNAHAVGPGTTAATRARSFIYFAYDTTTVSGTITGTGIDKTNVTITGSQDENVKYSILTEAQQPDCPTVLIGNLFQGLCKILGVHNFDCSGNTFIARAWRDGTHPVIKAANGVDPFKANGRVSLSSDTFTSDYLNESDWTLTLGVTPRGQAHEFTQFSQVSYQHDTQQNAIYTRVQARFFQTDPQRWIGHEPHKTGQVQILSDEPNRAALQIGAARINPDPTDPTTGAVTSRNNRTETVLANYTIFRAGNGNFAQQGYLGIFSSQTAAGDSIFRGVQTNGTWKGNALSITADTANGFAGDATIANLTTTNTLEVTTTAHAATIQGGTALGTAKLNGFGTGAQLQIGVDSAARCTATVTAATGAVEFFAVGSDPKFTFGQPVFFNAQINGGIINAGAGFRFNNVDTAAGQFLRSNGTNFVSSAIQEADISSGLSTATVKYLNAELLGNGVNGTATPFSKSRVAWGTWNNNGTAGGGYCDVLVMNSYFDINGGDQTQLFVNKQFWGIRLRRVAATSATTAAATDYRDVVLAEHVSITQNRLTKYNQTVNGVTVANSIIGDDGTTATANGNFHVAGNLTVAGTGGGGAGVTSVTGKSGIARMGAVVISVDDIDLSAYATVANLNLKAPLASPQFTGVANFNNGTGFSINPNAIRATLKSDGGNYGINFNGDYTGVGAEHNFQFGGVTKFRADLNGALIAVNSTAQFARTGGVLFNELDGNSASAVAESPLYLFKMPIGTLATDKDKVRAKFFGTFSPNANSKTLRFYFTEHYAQNFVTTNALDDTWVLEVTYMRVDAGTIRIAIEFTTNTIKKQTYTQFINAVNLNAAAYDIQVNSSSAVAGELNGRMAMVEFLPAR